MKKILSILLAAVMLFGVFAVSASAEDAIIYGDLDGDKKVNSNDALLILQYAVALKTFTAKEKLLADVDMSGAVNSGDALCILDYATEQITKFQKDYASTRKFNYVDKIVGGSAYTITATTVIEDMDTVMTFTAKGKESAVSTVVKTPFSALPVSSAELLAFKIALKAMGVAMDDNTFDMEIRYYTDKNGKSYMIVPITHQYSEVPSEEVPSELVSLLFATENLIVSAKNEKKGSQTYFCETYSPDGESMFKFYFTDNSLKRLTLKDAASTVDYTITKCAASATTSLLGIPSGYTKTDDALSDVT